MSRPARLADVAQQAGVSEATVSRVFNDKPGVAASTRTAVLEALDLLGYDRPSKLRPRQAGLVGLIVPELSNPVFPAFAQAIEGELTSAGYTSILCTQAPGGVHEDEYVRMLLDRGVAGIVYVSGHHANLTSETDRYTELLAKGLPIVMINGYRVGIDAPFVSTDDRVGVYLAVAHLASLGHTRIGLAVGPDRFVPVVRKQAAFVQAMAELGLAPVDSADSADSADVGDVDDLVASSLFTVDGGAQVATALLERGCTGIVCASDLMALGAIRAVRAGGLSVPEDVSVVGSDDSLLMAFTDPPLTTVRQKVAAIAEAAVTALLAGVRDEPPAAAEYLIRPDLVVRGSTAPVREGLAHRPGSG